MCRLVVPLPADMKPARKDAVSLLSGEKLKYEISKDGFLTVTFPQSLLEDIDTVLSIRKQ